MKIHHLERGITPLGRAGTRLYVPDGGGGKDRGPPDMGIDWGCCDDWIWLGLL